jgi:TolB protein
VGGSAPKLTGRLAVTVDATSIAVVRGDNRETVAGTRDLELTDPTWSPDGQRLAYAGGAPGGPVALYVVNADGSGRRRLTQQRHVIERSPAWSPDGRTIAFVKGDPSRGIYLMDTQGRHRGLLTKIFSDDPAWSPDGKRLVFSSDYSPRPLYVIDADGRHLRRLATPPPAEGDDGYTYYYVSPAWSPDGKRIAFDEVAAYNGRGGGELNFLHVIDADGRNDRTLSPQGSFDLAPTWSPGGRLIAFAIDGQIHTIEPSGQNERRLLVLRNRSLADPAWT